jgi:hypothetical protein
MKLSSCYLEKLDYLALRHVNRLNSWVGVYKIAIKSVSTDAQQMS